MASEGCKSAPETAVPDPVPAGPPQSGRGEPPESGAGEGRVKPVRTDTGTVMRVSTRELMFLAPRLRNYLTTTTPGWREIVDAADYLRGELGVSKSLWGEACLAMGREEAAIAIAIVSAKPAAHFRTSPGGYFHGMVAKAKAGELNLARTIWALRQAAVPETRGAVGRGGSPRPAARSWS